MKHSFSRLAAPTLCPCTLQTTVLLPQAVNVTPIVLSKQEADAIVSNLEPSKGPVFKAPRND